MPKQILLSDDELKILVKYHRKGLENAQVPKTKKDAQALTKKIGRIETLLAGIAQKPAETHAEGEQG